MPNRFNPDVPPAWHAVRIDETDFWAEEFRKEFGVEKIWGIYIADFNSRTYCCEMTPSYAMYFIESVPEGEPEDEDMRERLLDELRDGDRYTSEVAYFHCSHIRSLSDDRKHSIHIQEDEWRDDPEDSGYEVVREGYQGNPVW